MIHAVLIFNNTGLPRLTKYFVPPSQRAHISPKAIFSLVSQRAPQLCNFLDVPHQSPLRRTSSGLGTATGDEKSGWENGRTPVEVDRVIYRNYATLYFVFVVDEGESELGILDLIQVFVESLDRSFENVCELDLVFHFDEAHAILSEIVQGGVVLETNVDAIHEATQAAAQARRSSFAAANPLALGSGSGVSSRGAGEGLVTPLGWVTGKLLGGRAR
ncbi:Adaptor protein complex sigma subunit [Dacryopinax primogenitus]|uniref:AP complex subunit sigma n=1 Tax=Dacryopinax primogenitus (strain DJM 731) TaxID=1858805 RepID=M5G5A7_DACPD|nr:Adaptor protein complex sigma subunit [Dacryopinax primogenitus]EJU01012.1 Adaptor protein complex sigma subunit [Dacryopinax primogenitus]